MTCVNPERLDWALILDDLRGRGYSVYRVASILGRKWDTVKAWRTGEPKHSDGQALLKLYSDVIKGINP